MEGEVAINNVLMRRLQQGDDGVPHAWHLSQCSTEILCETAHCAAGKGGVPVLSLLGWGLFLGVSTPCHFWSALLGTTCASTAESSYSGRGA